jgi:hypothetical protein
LLVTQMRTMDSAVCRPHRLTRWVFLAAIPCLLLQLPIRYYTEPYPAILLPGTGPPLRTDSGLFTVKTTALIAEDNTGGHHSVSDAMLLVGVPTIYRRFVISRSFGINRDRDTRAIRLPGVGRWQPVTALTVEQVSETRAWLKSRLDAALGVTTVRLHILTYETAVSDDFSTSTRLLTDEILVLSES